MSSRPHFLAGAQGCVLDPALAFDYCQKSCYYFNLHYIPVVRRGSSTFMTPPAAADPAVLLRSSRAPRAHPPFADLHSDCGNNTPVIRISARIVLRFPAPRARFNNLAATTDRTRNTTLTGDTHLRRLPLDRDRHAARTSRGIMQPPYRAIRNPLPMLCGYATLSFSPEFFVPSLHVSLSARDRDPALNPVSAKISPAGQAGLLAAAALQIFAPPGPSAMLRPLARSR